MDQIQKEKVISDAYDYAREVARKEYADNKGLEYATPKGYDYIEPAKNLGLDIGTYFVVKQETGDMTSDKNEKTGKAVEYDRAGLFTRKTKVVDYLKEEGLDHDQRDVVMELFDTT